MNPHGRNLHGLNPHGLNPYARVILKGSHLEGALRAGVEDGIPVAREAVHEDHDRQAGVLPARGQEVVASADARGRASKPGVPERNL